MTLTARACPDLSKLRRRQCHTRNVLTDWTDPPHLAQAIVRARNNSFASPTKSDWAEEDERACVPAGQDQARRPPVLPRGRATDRNTSRRRICAGCAPSGGRRRGRRGAGGAQGDQTVGIVDVQPISGGRHFLGRRSGVEGGSRVDGGTAGGTAGEARLVDARLFRAGRGDLCRLRRPGPARRVPGRHDPSVHEGVRGTSGGGDERGEFERVGGRVAGCAKVWRGAGASVRRGVSRGGDEGARVWRRVRRRGGHRLEGGAGCRGEGDERVREVNGWDEPGCTSM